MSSVKKPSQQWREIGETPSVGRTEEFAPDVTRRKFLQALSLPALASLAGCDGPPPDAVPYVNQPENIIPGEPRFYASAVIFDGYVQPVIAETHEGRPTKLEGNPDHPCSRGTTDAFTQAAIADLYNPERSAAPLYMGRPASWNDADTLLLSLHGELAATRGEGFRLLTGPTSSPTFLRQLGELRSHYPGLHWHVMEGPAHGPRSAAIRSTFGDDFDLHLHPEAADVIVAFDDDFLGPGPAQTVNAMRWADRRRRAVKENAPVFLHVVESTPSLTGVGATTRKPLAPARIIALLHALARELGVTHDAAVALEGWEQVWVAARAQDLRKAGTRALVVAGAYLPVEAQSLAFIINHVMYSIGSTMQFTKSVIARPEGDGSFTALVRDMAAGDVRTLFIVDGNPAYAASGDINFADALGHVAQTVHLGLYDDETAAECRWHLPTTHALETWSDGRAIDGTVTVLQPLVRSFLDVRSIHDVLHRLTTGEAGDALTIVKATWADRLSGNAWPQVLDRGYVEATAFAITTPEPRLQHPASQPASADHFAIVIRPDPNVWDGRLALNLWLQELPKPLTKVTWENVVLLAPADARALKVANGDMIEIATQSGKVTGPVWIQPGQAAKAVTVFLGYGRRRAGRLVSAIGYDAAPLRTVDTPWYTTGNVTRVEGHRAIATTQAHSDMGTFDFVKTVARGETVPPTDDTPPTLYPPRQRGPVAWGMVIDLDLCIGCNSCVVACQSENNIPTVGQDQIRRGREMFWLRIDRYFEGPAEEPAIHFQPVPCMHCEQAPCEMGCPVNATTHNSEGLNQMVYNRCIGTRTCSSYCPYKVRHFNWYDYTGDVAPGEQAQRNPNVTVRGRGVMEKCTYCVQRINAAEIKAQKDGRGVRDGEVRTACQAACPTQAIVFGNISETDSGVSAARQSPRNYSLLAELATHPRTTYLAKIEDAVSEPEAPS